MATPCPHPHASCSKEISTTCAIAFLIGTTKRLLAALDQKKLGGGKQSTCWAGPKCTSFKAAADTARNDTDARSRRLEYSLPSTCRLW